MSATQKIKKKRNVLERCFRQLALKEMISLTSPERLLKAPGKYKKIFYYTNTNLENIKMQKVAITIMII